MTTVRNRAYRYRNTDARPTDTTLADWRVRADYGHENKTAHFEAPLTDIAEYFDGAELDGGTVSIDRRTGDISVDNQESGHRYRFRRKYGRTRVTAAMIDNLVRLDRSAKDYMRLVRTKDRGVRLFGFTFGLTAPQSDAIRDKGWVHIRDGYPAVTAIGLWVIDHVDDLKTCLWLGTDLHVHDRRTTRDDIRCRRCNALLSPLPVPSTEKGTADE